MCLQIAQAVALGKSTLAKQAAKGGVIYLCLEDGGRRLQDRLRKQGTARGLPITWYTSFPKLDADGMDQLAELAATKPRLIVIDTLAAAKSGKVDENASGPMAELGNTLRMVAQEFDVALLVTHHHGKFSYGDPGDDLRGSSALAAAADVNLGIYKADDSFRLRGEGRDIEPLDLAIRFDAHGTWEWQMLGDARTIASEEADSRILLALSALGEADADEVARHTEKSRQATADRLKQLAFQQRVIIREERIARGRPRTLYRLPEADAPSFSD